MNKRFKEVLERNPEAARIYETSPAFREALDEIEACFDYARENLSDEDYLDFLKYSMAYMQEWQ